jgi:predicted metallopeptidase
LLGQEVHLLKRISLAEKVEEANDPMLHVQLGFVGGLVANGQGSASWWLCVVLGPGFPFLLVPRPD